MRCNSSEICKEQSFIDRRSLAHVQCHHEIAFQQMKKLRSFFRLVHVCITLLSFEDGVAVQILPAPQRLETTHLAVLLILRLLIGAFVVIAGHFCSALSLYGLAEGIGIDAST